MEASQATKAAKAAQAGRAIQANQTAQATRDSPGSRDLKSIAFGQPLTGDGALRRRKHEVKRRSTLTDHGKGLTTENGTCETSREVQ